MSYELPHSVWSSSDSTAHWFQVVSSESLFDIGADMDPPPTSQATTSPDTVEHAAALAMFIEQAYNHIEEELHDSNNGRLTHDYNIKDSMRDLWGHVPGFLPTEHGQQQQQRDPESNPLQQQQAGQAAQQQQLQQCIFPPADDCIPQWDLAPHLDLQMHLPSDQLLLLLLHQSGLLSQQQQQQQEQKGSDPTTTANSSSSKGSSTTVPDLSFLVRHGRHLDRLFSHHEDGGAAVLAAQLAQHGVNSSSNDDAENMTAVERLMLACSKWLGVQIDASVCSRESAGPAGQQQQHSIAKKPVKESTSALASPLDHAGGHSFQQQQQQQQQTGCVQQPDGERLQQIDDEQQQQRWQTAEADHDGNISSDPGDICSSSSGTSSSSSSADQPEPAPDGHLRDVSLLALLADSLVLQFIAKQQAAAAAAGSSGAVTVWQQLLPLQVLLLLGQAQKLQGLSQQYEQLYEQLSLDEQVEPVCTSYNSSSSTNPSIDDSTSGSSCSTTTPSHCAADLQQRQRVLLQHMLECAIGLVQLLRQFDASNRAMPTAAAPEQDYVSNNNSSTNASSSCGGSVPEKQPLSPAAFFSAYGPLAAGIRQHGMQPSAAAGATGVLCTAASSTCSNSSMCCRATGAAGPIQDHSSADPVVSNSGSGDCHVQGIKDHDLRDLIWQILVGCCCWDHAAAASISATLNLVDSVPALQASLVREAQLQAEQMESEDVTFAVDLISRYPDQESGRDLKDLLPLRVISALGCIPDVVKHCIMQWRLAHLEQQGFDVLRWEATQEVKLQQEQQQQQMFLGITERHTIRSNGFQIIHMNQITPEEKALICGAKLERNQWLAALRNQAAVAAAAGADTGAGSSGNDDGLQHQLDQGLAAYRQLGLALCQQFEPLYEWHKQWFNQYAQQQQQAKDWWDSSDRQQLAQQGCVRKQRLLSQLPPQQQASGDNSSSGGGNVWQHGLHDRHSNCPLCQQEQQQQQEQQKQQQQQQQQEQQKHNYSDGHQPQQQSPGGSSSSSSSKVHASPCASPAVPYTDPFLWRRLLWQLLGKLSPAAQEFYAQYCAMCPHCTELQLWIGVRESITGVLWSSPTADVTDLQLYTLSWCTMGSNASRAKRVKQYAKAVNTAYLQAYSPAAVVVAKQVLLSLSPLHHSVLPPAETAMFLPSAFATAAQKCLQQQLLGKPVLQGLAHKSCGLTPWHVWWHLGIRRYHALGYHHQQQKQRQGPTQQLAGDAALWLLNGLGGNSSSNGSDNSNDSSCCARDVDAMYLDPDARLYAVGFATRQLNGAVFGNSKASGGSFNPTTDHHPFTFQDQVLALMRECQDALFLQAVGRHTGSPWATLVSKAEAGSELAIGLLHHYEQAREHLRVSLLERQLSTSVSVLTEPEYPPGPDRQKHQPSVSSFDYLVITAAYVEQSGDESLDRLELHNGGTRPFSSLPATSTDVQELALQAPIAFETLIDPVIWWNTQQKMLRLNDPCDHCNKQFASSEAGCTCANCNTPQYCSDWCFNRDAAQHAKMCHKLQHAQQRYAAAAGSSGSCPRPQQPFSRLLDLVKCTGEGGVLDRDTGVMDNLPPGILDPLSFVTLAGQRLEKFCRYQPSSKEDMALYRQAQQGMRHKKLQQQQQG